MNLIRFYLTYTGSGLPVAAERSAARKHCHDLERILKGDDLAFALEEFNDLNNEHLVERHAIGNLEQDLFFTVVADDASVTVGAVSKLHNPPSSVTVDDMADISLAVAGHIHADGARGP